MPAAETELVGVGDLEEVEEALEVEEDDGVTLEPFNLAQERREGYFDEGGHYVEHRNKDEEELEKDAWLASSKGELCITWKLLMSCCSLHLGHIDARAWQNSHCPR